MVKNPCHVKGYIYIYIYILDIIKKYTKSTYTVPHG